MKKIYLSMFAMGLFAMGANAQLVKKATKPYKPAPFYKTVSPAVNTTLLQKSNIWTEDFDVTATGSGTFTTANGIWTTAGANADVWKHTFTTSNGQYSGTPSALETTTGGNGGMIFDSDSLNELLGNGPTTFANFIGELISPPIDLTGETSVFMTLEQDFRFCCTGALAINVTVSSDNGVTWSTPYNLAGTTMANDSYFADNGDSYLNETNITADAAGNTVLLKFSWVGDNPQYYWILDDICLTPAPVNDIVSQQDRWGTTGAWEVMLPYYQVPVNQIQPVDFSAFAFNNGQDPQTNVQLNVDAGSGAFTASSPGIVVQPGNSDTLALGVQYTPAATLVSNPIVWGITQMEVDERPLNNTLSNASIEITNSTYARDAGVIDGGSFNSGDGYEAGNIFDMFTSDNIFGVDITIGNQTEVNAFIQAKLYSVDDDGNFIQQDASQFYTVTAADLGNQITLPLLSATSGGTPLNAGESYLVVVSTDGDGGATNDLVVATSGQSEPQTTFYFDATQQDWFFITNTSMVRMNFDETLTVEEPAQVYGVNLFPNPSTDEVNISYNIVNASDVSIEVIDITGKVIASINEGTKTEGKHIISLNTDAFANGMYYVSIASNNTVVTEKLIKK